MCGESVGVWSVCVERESVCVERESVCVWRECVFVADMCVLQCFDGNCPFWESITISIL